jgi:hypothetical protein
MFGTKLFPLALAHILTLESLSFVLKANHEGCRVLGVWSQMSRPGEAADAGLPQRGDSLRASTGIRPSLHPVTINALSKVIVARASGNVPDDPFTEASPPIERALFAGRIAADAIASRQTTSKEDGMTLTPAEQQTVAGRVVGVTVRLSSLEHDLHRRCGAAPWISKFNAWDSFGVLADESDASVVNDRIAHDPLFALNRAECLLAVYVRHVEEPELRTKNATVPGGSTVDFIDDDRRSVLA